MGQKLYEDKISSLSHNAGVITLASGSKTTIGGQQYINSALSRTISTDVTLVANTLYMVYAVVSGGTVQLRISTNFNSVGPSGFASWKLVGAFYSNGSISSAFGSFINTKGTPTSDSVDISTRWAVAVRGTSNEQVFTNSTLVYAKYSRSGENMKIYAKIEFQGLPGTGTGDVGIRLDNLSLDILKYEADDSYIHKASFIDSSTGANYAVTGRVFQSAANVYLMLRGVSPTGATFNVGPTNPVTIASGDFLEVSTEFPITTWSSTPLEDL